MTDYASSQVLRDSMSDFLSGQCLIVAHAAALDAFAAQSPGGRLESATLLPLDPSQALPREPLDRARVLVLEIDTASDASMRRLAAVRVSHPKLVIIAAIEEAGVSVVRALIRQGVADVAELPFNAPQLEEQVLDALSSQIEIRAKVELGKAITVVGASGGCGATSVLTHLAEELAKQTPNSRGVCLIDLDLQKGSTASYLGLEPVVTIQSLIESGNRLDRELMMSAVTDTKRGFCLIAAPDTIQPTDHIDVDQLLAIVNLVRSQFDYVLIDLPPMWNDWTLSLVSWSNRVVLLTDSSIANLRQARRTIALLGSVDVPASRISVAVNRVERKLFAATKLEDVSRALDSDDLVSISDVGMSLRSAQDQGVPLGVVQGKNRFTQDIAALAETIVQGNEPS